MPPEVLIRGVNWVGDAVMSMPAVRAVAKAFPGAGVSLLAKPWVLPLFERYPALDELIPFDERFTGAAGLLMGASEIRRRGFKTAILLQNAFGAALMARLAGIPRTIGYARDMRGFLLTDPVPYHGEDRRMHHIDYYLELLRRSGLEAPHTEPWIFLDLKERLAARERLAALKRPVIGLNPGAAYGSAKQWLPDRFAEVATRTVRELEGSAVVFGGPAETGVADEIRQRYDGDPQRLMSMAGKTTLRELAALISECDAFISNDSGPMHMGYALRTPMVAVFGSTDPALTGPPPSLKGNVVLKSGASCAPCFRRKCPDRSMRCMSEITVDSAISALNDVLPRRRAVFFDRDGTLCVDAHFLNDWDRLEVFPEITGLGPLKGKDFKLIGVSNQSGVGRGIVDEGFVREVNEMFVSKYGFDGFYYCPHHPDEGCDCRKPSPGMLLMARAEHGVDLKRSYVVGDKDDDMLLARAVGARAVLVLTGKQSASEHADIVARDLGEAARMIASEL